MSGDYNSVGARRQGLYSSRFQWIGRRESVGFYDKVVWIGLPAVIACDESARRIKNSENRIREHAGNPEASKGRSQCSKHYAFGLGPAEDKATDQNIVTGQNASPGREVERLRSHCRKLRIFQMNGEGAIGCGAADGWVPIGK